MKKIIQIQAIGEDGLFCLTEDGKVYERIYIPTKMNHGQTCAPSPLGKIIWKEIPAEGEVA